MPQNDGNYTSSYSQLSSMLLNKNNDIDSLLSDAGLRQLENMENVKFQCV